MEGVEDNLSRGLSQKNQLLERQLWIRNLLGNIKYSRQLERQTNPAQMEKDNEWVIMDQY